MDDLYTQEVTEEQSKVIASCPVCIDKTGKRDPECWFCGEDKE